MRSRRNIDTSPYGSNNNAYLSPPQESSWRRTSSDSAIHQSLTQAQVWEKKIDKFFFGLRGSFQIVQNSAKNISCVSRELRYK